MSPGWATSIRINNSKFIASISEITIYYIIINVYEGKNTINICDVLHICSLRFDLLESAW